ncbi:FUSC family protein [Lichenihabitans psoromatis]|uniref:FUSC family protein n=1 Tax=Lichenihabitans psoromatis TaxID=2528642 RepID=UPI0010382F52|nr:FUSC family protein [Lichenihabitans psoromatis]
MMLPTGREWLYSIKTFVAAMAAIYLAVAMSLPRPYWAMATVYICSQPLSGSTRSKAAYRVVGTMIGAAAAVALVPNLVNAPELLVFALALWVAVCLYASLLDRSPRSYVFMLAGYTAALIGFPTVLDPATIFDTAVARVEEITVGIVCASVVAGLFWPMSVGEVVAGRANIWLGHAARLTRDILSGPDAGERTRGELIRLAGDAAEIDMLSTHLAYDISRLSDLRGHMRALRLRMLMVLPVLSSIGDRMSALRALDGGTPPQFVPLIDAVMGWIQPGDLSPDKTDAAREMEEADRLRRMIAAASPRLTKSADWSDILGESLLIRLREFVDIASDTRMLRRAIRSGQASLPGPLAFDPGTTTVAVQHRDHAMALLSCLAVMVAIILCSALWIGTGWPDGSAAPMLAAVACCFFASRDDPVPAILQFANWSGVAVLIMAVYQFAILPTVHDFEMLVLVLAPTFLVIGALIARPTTMGIGLALAANGAAVLALQSNLGSSDFAAYVNPNLALLIGMYIGAIVMRLMRSVGAEWAIWRLIASARRTIVRAARHRGRHDRNRFIALMLDRIGLISPKLASLEPDTTLKTIDLLGGVRIGLNVIDLRRARHGLPQEAILAIDRLLDGLAHHYEGRRKPPAPTLLACVDHVLTILMSVDDGAGRRDALLGAVGVRRGLFPDAPPYRALLPDDPASERLAA